jgi:type I restriction-modification system DNA methylase subunit
VLQQPDLFQQPPQERLAEFHVRNQKLFSNYYLAYKLPERLLWRSLEARARQAFEQIKEAYQDMAVANLFSAKNEAETERVFIRPSLKALGFKCFSVQPSLDSYDARLKPDYAIFPNRESYEAAQQNREDMRIFYGKAVAIGEAKYWARPMNDRDPNDTVDHSDATKQIVGYLRDVAEWTDGKTNWGILTNGKLWRLFHRRADYTAENYVEIDLEEIIQENNFEAFKYFYALFSHEAFVIQPDESISWLESYLKESEDYSTDITKHLKELIFEKVFDGLIHGFVHYRRDKLGITHEDATSKRVIFQGCLTLLYRLLFLLNAESRQLLPMDNPGYRKRSLRALIERIWEERSERRDPRHDFEYWYHLKRLFEMMNDSIPEFNLPRYNGGLFKRPDPNTPLDQLSEEEIGPWFLEKHELADPYLRDAIEQLTFDPEAATPSARAFIDYSSLGVRHLGEIYEGLLEFKVEIAEDEPVCAVGSKKKPQWKKQSEVTDEDIVHFIKQIGEPYITNDKGERKATGSYYTPHYIVQYIVEHTIGPQLDRFEREKQWHDRITSADADLGELYEEIVGATASEEEWERLGALWKSCKSDEERRAFLINHLDPEAEHDFDPATRALGLKVLDPAMGSGHFLVHAVDVIADRVANFLNKYPDSSVVKQLERLRESILENVREQGVQIDESRLNDVNLIKRMVMKRCIYGVDLNPMAVELAKLSLWLDSFTVGAPLSFLDHHLRCGNSLIGTTVEEVKTALEGERQGEGIQLGLLTSQFTGLMRAVELMQQVGELSDATIPELEESQARYERAIAQLAPFKAMLDIWVSEYFGNDSAQETLKQTPEAVEKAIHYLLRHSDQFNNNGTILEIVQKALQISKERYFFHWELEFPEVWYEGGRRRVNPGFDAVIGNPPYGLISDADTKSLIQQTFASAQYQPDSYVAFMESAYMLTRQGGYQSLIVPTTFLAMHYFSAIRRLLLDHCCIVSLAHLKFPVFEDSTVESALYVCQSEADSDKRRGNIIRGIVVKDLNDFIVKRFEVRDVPQTQFEKVPENDFNISPGASQYSIIEKMRNGLVKTLGQMCEMTVGVKPYQVGKGNPKQTREVVEKRVFDANYCKDVTYRQYLMGRDIDRYLIAPLEERWISYGEWLAEPRPEAPFLEPKRIIIRQTGDSIIAALEDKQRLTLNNIHNLRARQQPPTYEYLLAILNSRLITYFHHQIVPEADRVFAEVKIVDLERLPIRLISFTTSEAERMEQVKTLQELYQQGDFDELLESVEACLPKGSDGEFIAFRQSISVEQAIKKGVLTEEQAKGWALESGDPSSYDENGNPLERSDVVHDFLAYLAERMIEMNKDKREIIEKFWTDLEGVTASETFKKLRRGKQEKTLARRSKACRPFVKAESGSAKHLDESLAWSEDAFKDFAKLLAGRIGNLSDLVEVYHKHTPDYKQLVSSIEATDKLIDQIVYKLYGLTEDEIAIVEGKA